MGRETMRARPALAVPLISALLPLALLLGGAAAPGEAEATAPAPPPPRATLSAEGCAACHPAIADEWRASMHAQSTKETDPLYRAMVAKAEATLGEKARAGCSRCHYPEWAGAPPEAGVVVEGVSCVVCHVLAPKHPEERLEDGRLARLAGGDVARYGAEKLCIQCHGTLKTPEGHPVCSTGPESDQALAGNCTDCHMAEAKGAPTKGVDKPSHASHGFPGGRSERLLRTAATVSLSFEGAGPAREIVANVEAGEVGHFVPTGTPMRSMVLTVTAFGADDVELWRNHAGAPLTEAPDALFQLVFSDREGNRPVPGFLAYGKGVDRRLRTDGPRAFRYPLPKDTKRVTAVLTYHLGPAKLLEAAGAPEAWRRPVVVAEAEATP